MQQPEGLNRADETQHTHAETAPKANRRRKWLGGAAVTLALLSPVNTEIDNRYGFGATIDMSRHVQIEGESTEVNGDILATANVGWWKPWWQVVYERLNGDESGSSRSLSSGPPHSRPINSEPAAAGIGVQAVGETMSADMDVGYDLPFSLDRVWRNAAVGSSHGLPMAILAAEHASERDLTQGRVVAATGKVQAVNGSVTSVGGLDRKAAAARRSEADVFFIPQTQTEREEITNFNAVDMQIVGVASVEEAVEYLQEPLDDQQQVVEEGGE